LGQYIFLQITNLFWDGESIWVRIRWHQISYIKLV